MVLRLTLLGASLLVLAGCSHQTLTGRAQQTPVLITVLHTNDHHGRFWKNGDGEYGMSARKTVVDAIRKEVSDAGGFSLLLDGGDVNTGVPESDLQDAVPDFRGMNLLGYDAMAVGNHEFDKPPLVLRMQRQLATFPMLSANIYQKGKGDRLFDPYKVFVLGGVRVAVIGLTTEDTRKMAHPDSVRDLDFRDPIAEAAALVPQMRAKVDVVIAATHMGHYADGNHGTLAPGDVEMARAVKGIDLIVGGHSQNPACMKAENVMDVSYVPGSPCAPDRQNGAWIVQAHEWGKYVGRADFSYRNGTFTLVKYALIPINLKGTVGNATQAVPEDPAMLALLSPYQSFGQTKLSVEVGQSTGRFEGDRTVVRRQRTDLGELIGRAMMEKTAADFAIMNSGGVRESLPAGSITYKDILKVHPFGTTIATTQLSGKEVLDYLTVVANMSPGSGAFPQVAGIRFTLDRGTVDKVHIQGEPLNHTRTYRMVINNFVAAAGDGFPKMTSHPSYVDTGFVDADVLKAFIARHSPIDPANFVPK